MTNFSHPPPTIVIDVTRDAAGDDVVSFRGAFHADVPAELQAAPPAGVTRQVFTAAVSTGGKL